jgi:hypothetical protein
LAEAGPGHVEAEDPHPLARRLREQGPPRRHRRVGIPVGQEAPVRPVERDEGIRNRVAGRGITFVNRRFTCGSTLVISASRSAPLRTTMTGGCPCIRLLKFFSMLSISPSERDEKRSCASSI